MMEPPMQQTLRTAVPLEGKGLHSGRHARLRLCPAPPDTGIVFVRTDLGGASVPALAEYVSATRRGTSLTAGEASVATVEHLLSALTGCGVDNAFVEIDNVEVPILDGSARAFVEAVERAGLESQDRPRVSVVPAGPLEVRDETSGSWIRIEPSDALSLEVTVDFGSDVLGVQTVRWDPSVDYASEIGCCRTFVFFHEIAALYDAGLVRGGDVDNAIVVADKPVRAEEVNRLARLFGVSRLGVKNGYLDNLELRFPDECGRHKMLDLIGDLRLSGGFPQCRITAWKPGHTLNTRAARLLREKIETI